MNNPKESCLDLTNKISEFFTSIINDLSDLEQKIKNASLSDGISDKSKLDLILLKARILALKQLVSTSVNECSLLMNIIKEGPFVDVEVAKKLEQLNKELFNLKHESWSVMASFHEINIVIEKETIIKCLKDFVNLG